LHNLAKAALADDLEELKVVNGQSVLPVFDKVDANLHGTTAKLDVNPVGAGLACGRRLLSGLFILALLFEPRADS
jgi:hypothetical protein